ncbi:shikimate dehydrogenase [Loigolactobacillus backii]|uniref:shikimate dehydrogenase n=1 Tax=Loigolactobacillus backii TaxID=375175 RepID=UPI000C1CA63D|nr:shikimate dehydrogenase [Loigolactobacillus backii]PIO83729.1 shikimate dehydrogenase [Loigolactobacillus backii]
MIDGHTKLYGFFAHPAHHSLSPLMYNLSFQAHEINARYLAFDLSNDFSQAIAAVRTLGLGGINLSMPYKLKVLPLLDELSATAKLVGAVNTVVNDHGRLRGENTDGKGLILALQADGRKVKGKQIAILGAGGAGMSIIAAAAFAGAAKITVFKRQNQTFTQVAQRLSRIEKVTGVALELCDYADEATMAQVLTTTDYLINTTNIGMGQGNNELPVPAKLITSLATNIVVTDIIYFPRETAFLKLARQNGNPTYNGLGMLIYQGALAFQTWTAKQMPITTVTTALEQALYQPQN